MRTIMAFLLKVRVQANAKDDLVDSSGQLNCISNLLVRVNDLGAADL